MKKLLLLLLGLTMYAGMHAQTGYDCTNPIPVSTGLNVWNYEGGNYYSYTVPSNNRRITVFSCGLTTENTNLEVYKGCTSFSEYTSGICGEQSYFTTKAMAGEILVFKWNCSSTFNWQLNDEPYVDYPGSSPANPSNAFEGQNQNTTWEYSKPSWYKYIAPVNGSITVSTCGYGHYYGSVYIFNKRPFYPITENNDYLNLDPNLLSAGAYNCSGYGTEVKVNVFKGDTILIMFNNEGEYNNLNKWDLLFSPSVLNAGSDSRTPLALTLGQKLYPLFGSFDYSKFSYFSFVADADTNYKITINTDVYEWGLWDSINDSKNLSKAQAYILKGKKGKTYRLGIWAEPYNYTSDISVTFEKTIQKPSDPCGSIVNFTTDIEIATNLLLNPDINYAYKAPDEGILILKTLDLEGSQHAEFYTDCKHQNYVGSQWLDNDFNSSNYYNQWVDSSITYYLGWDNRYSIFNWKAYFFKSTDFLTFGAYNQTSTPVINYTNHTIQVEISNTGSLSNVYINFDLPSGSFSSINSVNVNSDDYFDFSSGSLTFKVESYTGKSQLWTVSVTKAASVYSTATISSFTILGQTTVPTITGNTITANVAWSNSGYYFKANLSKGASIYNDYFYFDTEISTSYTGQITVNAENSSSQNYTLNITRVVPDGVSCQKPIVLNAGTNSNNNWKKYYVFSYTAKQSQALKISNPNIGAWVRVKDCCDYSCTVNKSEWLDNNGSYFVQVNKGTTYYLSFESDVTTFTIAEVPLLKDKKIEYVYAYLGGEDYEKNIDTILQKVTVKVPFGTNISTLELEIDISQGATAFYNASPIDNYFTHDYTSGPATIEVMAMDSTSTNWQIFVEKLPVNTQNSILSFALREQISPAIMNEANKTVKVLVAQTANVSSIVPSFILSDGAYAYIGKDYQLSQFSANNFTDPVVYDIISQDSIVAKWTVTVQNASDNDADILQFNLHGQVGATIIDQAKLTINAKVMNYVNKSALLSYFALSPGATAKVAGSTVSNGSALNFATSPVDFVVTSKNGAVKTWKVIIDQVQQTECKADFAFTIKDNLVTFANTSLGKASVYKWDFGDGTVASTFSASKVYSKSGAYNVCLNISDEAAKCSSQKCATVNFTYVDKLTADFTYTIDSTTNKVTFVNASSVSAATYIWYFGDGGVSKTKNTERTYKYAGTYYVCLTAISATGSTTEICKEITVGSQCNVWAYLGYAIDGNKVTFTDASEGDYDSWSWSFGDGAISKDPNPEYTYKKAGYYQVTLSVRKTGTTCFSSWTEYILIGTIDCKASFTVATDQASKKATFNNTSTGNLSKYYWNFGDGTFSTLQNPSKTYTKTGIYYVSLTVTDQTGLCMDFANDVVNIGAGECIAGFTYFTDIQSLTLYLSSNDNNPANNHLWVMGDGSVTTVKSPIQKFKYAGYYTIRHTTFNLNEQCADYYEEVVLVGEEGSDCEAGFIFQPNGKSVLFFDKSKGDVSKYLWSFGDGKTANIANPSNTYNTGGYYNVCLTVANNNGISNITCNKIAVDLSSVNNCDADFGVVVDSVTRTATFVDRSTGTPNKWEWAFGDGKTSTVANPTNIYTSADYYLASLKITTASGCKSSQYKLLNVAKIPGLKAKFGAEEAPKKRKAGGYPIDFIGAGLGDQAKLKWTFGDGESDTTSTTPTHEYAEKGTYNVCYEVSDPVTGASDKHCEDVVATGQNDVKTNINGKYNVYPVPVLNELTIQYDDSERRPDRIDITDMTGRRIASINNIDNIPGSNIIKWDASHLKSGVYLINFIRLNNKPVSLMITKE